MEKNVQLKYRLFRRRNGVFYWQENDSSKQGTLRTTDRREAEWLLNAMNESHREPTLNLNLARAYLAAHDPRMAQRTWQAVMDEMATHGTICPSCLGPQQSRNPMKPMPDVHLYCVPLWRNMNRDPRAGHLTFTHAPPEEKAHETENVRIIHWIVQEERDKHF